MKQRIAKLRHRMNELCIDAMLVSSFENYRYFSGFCGSNCKLIITQADAILLTDGRYTEQARTQAPDFAVLSAKGSMHDLLCEAISNTDACKVGFETMKMSDYEASKIKNALPNISWVPIADFGLDFRMIKDEDEIKNIRRAVKIADDALSALIPQIKCGMSEREIAALLEFHMAQRGSEHPAFETIAASGVRSSLPHGAPTDKKIENGDLLTLDFGACAGGYMSDITRTLWIGDPPDALKSLYAAVFDVQRACVAAVKPGICVSELDLLQRKMFESRGLSEYICHSLGHGVGLEIHEAPTVSRLSDALLAPGMVITIEPGLYIPNVGGVRIEDTVLVTDCGHEVLTASPHNIKIDCNK